MEIYNGMISGNDSDLHARSPSGRVTCSPLIRAANSSVKEDVSVFCDIQNISSYSF